MYFIYFFFGFICYQKVYFLIANKRKYILENSKHLKVKLKGEVSSKNKRIDRIRLRILRIYKNLSVYADELW